MDLSEGPGADGDDLYYVTQSLCLLALSLEVTAQAQTWSHHYFLVGTLAVRVFQTWILATTGKQSPRLEMAMGHNDPHQSHGNHACKRGIPKGL